jgi:hypothetical protein
MYVQMHVRGFFGWLFITAVISLAIGVVAGGAYATHQADGVIKLSQQRYDKLKADFDAIMELNGKLQDALKNENAATGKLLDRTAQDEESTGDSTVIYERSPQIQISFTALRGLPVLPLPGNGQELPRVLIPGHVKPLILAPDGDARQAVFYYMDRKNRLDGPYLPEVVRP